MRIMFVMDQRVDRGSIQSMANYVRAGDAAGHVIALYGCPDPRFPTIRFTMVGLTPEREANSRCESPASSRSSAKRNRAVMRIASISRKDMSRRVLPLHGDRAGGHARRHPEAPGSHRRPRRVEARGSAVSHAPAHVRIVPAANA